MTNYVKSTAFTSKDTLPAGNALKIVRGSELDTEFNNLAVSIATKADLLSPEFTGTPTVPTAAVGTSTTQIASTAFVSTAAPTGSINMWPTGTAPSGFLLCNGAAASRTTYAALFAVLGTVYGAGDGSTTFNLPNFVNRSPIGAGSLYGANTQIGSKDASVISHSHYFSGTTGGQSADHSHVYQYGGNAWNAGPYGSASHNGTTNTGGTSNDHTHNYSGNTSTVGGSGTDANLQPSLGIYFIIKT